MFEQKYSFYNIDNKNMKVNGLLGQYSVLATSEIVNKILSKYTIIKPYTCKFYSQGINDIYQIEEHLNTYYLRVSTCAYKTYNQLSTEIQVLETLLQQDISVVVPVKNIEGEYINTINACEGVRYAILFEEVKGDLLHNPNHTQNWELGKKLQKCT